MAERKDRPPEEGDLNPALKKRNEMTHDTAHATPVPADSASVQGEEGKPWPWIWLVVTIVSVILAIYLIFF